MNKIEEKQIAEWLLSQTWWAVLEEPYNLASTELCGISFKIEGKTLQNLEKSLNIKPCLLMGG